eukprot:scaffold17793_cov131-Isochrysis_galbana.AAC.2
MRASCQKPTRERQRPAIAAAAHTQTISRRWQCTGRERSSRSRRRQLLREPAAPPTPTSWPAHRSARIPLLPSVPPTLHHAHPPATPQGTRGSARSRAPRAFGSLHQCAPHPPVPPGPQLLGAVRTHRPRPLPRAARHGPPAQMGRTADSLAERNTRAKRIPRVQAPVVTELPRWVHGSVQQATYRP